MSRDSCLVGLESRCTKPKNENVLEQSNKASIQIKLAALELLVYRNDVIKYVVISINCIEY